MRDLTQKGKDERPAVAQVVGVKVEDGLLDGRNGVPGRNRTYDQLLRRQLLYPLSYRDKRNRAIKLSFHGVK